jgi:hypothetical protein
MSEGSGRSPAARAGRHRWIPFWVLQASEVAIALVFMELLIHVSNGGLLVAAAVTFFALAVTARGPLGVFRICGQRLHLTLATAAAAAVAVAPVIPALRPDIQGIIVIEFGAVGLIRLATLTLATDYPRATGTSRRRRGVVIDTTATVVDASTAGRTTAGRTTAGRTTAGRTAAGPTTTGRQPGDQAAAPRATTPPAGAAARWAGRTTGAAAASAKKMTARYRPEAEAQVKRTIREAGRIAGRMSGPKPPDDPVD